MHDALREFVSPPGTECVSHIMGSGRLSEPDIKQENTDITAIFREQGRLMRNETRRYGRHKERWRQNLQHTRGLQTNTLDPVTQTLPAATI